MPRRTIRCRQVRQSGGTIYARFSDKSEHEFESRRQMRQWIADRLSDEVIKAILLAKVLEDAADGSPLNQCDGVRATLDFSLPTFLTVEVSQ